MLEEITNESWKELDSLAKASDHQLWAPTHVVRKEGEVVGGISIGGVPLVNVFYGSKIRANDTFVVQSQVEEVIKANGWNDYLVSLSPDSPMYKHASKWGLIELGSTFLHYKKI